MLLQIWERGVHASNVRRALLLMGAALPEVNHESLMHASIGHRDAWLLTLRETLFGSRIECLLPCPACAEQIELNFRVSDIRAPHALPRHVCEVMGAGSVRRFRVPTSADLLAIEGERDVQAAERQLLARLWETPDAEGVTPRAPEWLAQVHGAVAQAIAEADAQAEVRLALSCPSCGLRTEESFDIAAHLWCELDHWARAMLRKVHALASRYGWSEDCILGMGTARRQAYLGLIGEA
jgi:hypothetical protein